MQEKSTKFCIAPDMQVPAMYLKVEFLKGVPSNSEWKKDMKKILRKEFLVFLGKNKMTC